VSTRIRKKDENIFGGRRGRGEEWNDGIMEWWEERYLRLETEGIGELE